MSEFDLTTNCGKLPFNLSEKRKELFNQIRKSKSWNEGTQLIFSMIEEQDKEFIKKLKEIDFVGLVRENIREDAENKIHYRINKIAGNKLTGKPIVNLRELNLGGKLVE